MTIEHSDTLAELVETYGLDGVVRELFEYIRPEDLSVDELGGAYDSLATIQSVEPLGD